jgi:uncharacterized protein YqgC (DUF456 family)
MGTFELLIIALIIVAIGLVGTMLPGLPGMPLVLGGIALFAIGTQFRYIGSVQFAVFVFLGLLGLVLNYLGQLFGARRFGASRAGMLGAIVGLVVGLFVFPPFGLVIGPLTGAIVAELVNGREMNAALRSGVGVVIGYLFGSLAEVLIAIIMTGWFLWSTLGVLTSPPPGSPGLPTY